MVLYSNQDVLLLLDARQPDVVVPENLRTNPNLALEIGYDMPNPIPDLNVGSDGVSATLSFHATSFRCWLPWAAVHGVLVRFGALSSPSEPPPAPEPPPKAPRPRHLKLVD